MSDYQKISRVLVAALGDGDGEGIAHDVATIAQRYTALKQAALDAGLTEQVTAIEAAGLSGVWADAVGAVSAR